MTNTHNKDNKELPAVELIPTKPLYSFTDNKKIPELKEVMDLLGKQSKTVKDNATQDYFKQILTRLNDIGGILTQIDNRLSRVEKFMKLSSKK